MVERMGELSLRRSNGRSIASIRKRETSICGIE